MIYEAGTVSSFSREVSKRSGQNLSACYQCRRCAAGCPVAEECAASPDKLIRLILLGDKAQAFQSLLTGKCVVCYTCGTRCPNSIQTSRIIETLKQMAKEEGIEVTASRVADFHEAFMTATERRGRFNEIEGMAIYETKTVFKELMRGRVKAVVLDLMNQARLGIAFIKKGRMHLGVEKIERQSEVKALFEKAKKSKSLFY